MRVAQSYISQVKRALKSHGYSTQQALADDLVLCRATVHNYLNGRPVNYLNFVEISERLGQDWQEIADDEEPPIDTSSDTNFVGREGAIRDLKTLVNEGAKVIGIYGKGGVGKTTLAQQYFKIQGVQALTLMISLETEDITPVEDWLRYRLRQDLHEEPESNFYLMLDQLKCKLKAQQIGVLVDNLEPALDANGQLLEAHRRYVELLRVLADPSVQSITLITSRAYLNEPSVNIEPYELPGLDEQAWRKFFETHKINFINDSLSLRYLHRDYGGNPKAMKIISCAILEDFRGNLEDYWQHNQGNLWIRRELKNLVESQFNRLEELVPQAHQLLCRLGCYRYQDVPRVPQEGLYHLLWDVPKEQHNEVIRCLRDRALVDFCGEYWLHPVIRAEAIRRLRASDETWKEVNQKVANFYSYYSHVSGSINHSIKVKAAFEAINHFYEIQDFERGCQILISHILEVENDNNLENLTISENLWSNQARILKICDQAVEALSDELKLQILIPMGYIYSACGIHSSLEVWREEKKPEKALNVSRKILDNTKKLLPSDHRYAFAEMSAYLIASKANRFTGKLPEALKASEEATRIAKRSGKSYWKALSLYELGLVYLEIDKPGRALRRIVAAAFLASSDKPIPKEVYQLYKTQISNLSPQIENVFDKYNETNEASRRKKFAVLLNIARCLNLMKLSFLAATVLDIIERNFLISLTPETYTENCLFYLERAICYLATGNDKKAKKNYQKALELSNFKDKGFRSFILIKFADWQYKMYHYLEALAIYKEIEDVLKEISNSPIKAKTYYQISCIYLKCDFFDREKAIDYLQQAKNLCQELELPLLDKVMKLEEDLSG